MKTLLVKNLGLGDSIICNAIVRHLAANNDLVCICEKYWNVPSVQFMFRDLENVVIRPVEDADEQDMFARRVWKDEVLWTGCSGLNFTDKEWDKQFYRQARLPFEDRWNRWKCVRDEGLERHIDWPKWGSNWPANDCMFVHDDRDRGIVISQKYLEQKQVEARLLIDHWEPAIVRPDPSKPYPIFAYWGIIERAKVIHCISSCFALFIDSIDLPKKPELFLHAYARGNEALPSFRKPWKILIDP